MQTKMTFSKEYVIGAYESRSSSEVTYIDEDCAWTYKLENAWRMTKDQAIKVAGEISRKNKNLPMHLLRIEVTDIAEITNTLR